MLNLMFSPMVIVWNPVSSFAKDKFIKFSLATKGTLPFPVPFVIVPIEYCIPIINKKINVTIRNMLNILPRNTFFLS